ncbi:hypothetical protein [Desulfogranum mediterraneum]|uniref:hypothetical protein n=1 Tax=Desulfogranum mediterraneum TaxID=160661 RepID=UPI00048AD613|nr:hypothetical protein [Desulfogranum mediterraneum]
MKTYRTQDTDQEELGDKSVNQILDLVKEANASVEDPVQIGIGIYRTKQDFLEIRPVGKGGYLLWSDYIALPFWQRLLSGSNIEPVVQGILQISNRVGPT